MLSKTHQFKTNKTGIIETNKELLQKLSSNSELHIINDYEILPYDFLWGIIFKYLQD